MSCKVRLEFIVFIGLWQDSIALSVFVASLGVPIYLKCYEETRCFHLVHISLNSPKESVGILNPIEVNLCLLLKFQGIMNDRKKSKKKGKDEPYSPTDMLESDTSNEELDLSKRHLEIRNSSPSSSSGNSSDDSSSSYEYTWEEAKPPKPPFQPFVTSVNVGAIELPAVKREYFAVIPLKAVLVILFPDNTPGDLECGIKKLDLHRLTKFEADLLTNHVKGLRDSDIRTFTVGTEIYVAEFSRGEIGCSYESLKTEYSTIMNSLLINVPRTFESRTRYKDMKYDDQPFGISSENIIYSKASTFGLPEVLHNPEKEISSKNAPENEGTSDCGVASKHQPGSYHNSSKKCPTAHVCDNSTEEQHCKKRKGGRKGSFDGSGDSTKSVEKEPSACRRMGQKSNVAVILKHLFPENEEDEESGTDEIGAKNKSILMGVGTRERCALDIVTVDERGHKSEQEQSRNNCKKVGKSAGNKSGRNQETLTSVDTSSNRQSESKALCEREQADESNHSTQFSEMTSKDFSPATRKASPYENDVLNTSSKAGGNANAKKGGIDCNFCDEGKWGMTTRKVAPVGVSGKELRLCITAHGDRDTGKICQRNVQVELSFEAKESGNSTPTFDQRRSLEYSSSGNDSLSPNAEWAVKDSYTCQSPEDTRGKSPENRFVYSEAEAKFKEGQGTSAFRHRTRDACRAGRKSLSPSKREFSYKIDDRHRKGRADGGRRGIGDVSSTNSRQTIRRVPWRREERYGGSGQRTNILIGSANRIVQRTARFVPDYSKLRFRYRPELYSPVSSAETDFGDADEEESIFGEVSKHKVLHRRSSRDDIRMRSKQQDREASGTRSDASSERSSVQSKSRNLTSHRERLPKFPVRRENSVEPDDIAKELNSANKSGSPTSDAIGNLVVGIRQDCENRIVRYRDERSSKAYRRSYHPPRFWRVRRRSHSPSRRRSFSPPPRRSKPVLRPRRRSLTPISNISRREIPNVNQREPQTGNSHRFRTNECSNNRQNECADDKKGGGGPDTVGGGNDFCSAMRSAEVHYSSLQHGHNATLVAGSHTTNVGVCGSNELVRSRHNSSFTPIFQRFRSHETGGVELSMQEPTTTSSKSHRALAANTVSGSFCHSNLHLRTRHDSDDEQVIILKGPRELNRSAEDIWPFLSSGSDHDSSMEDSCDGEVEGIMSRTLKRWRDQRNFNGPNDWVSTGTSFVLKVGLGGCAEGQNGYSGVKADYARKYHNEDGSNRKLYDIELDDENKLADDNTSIVNANPRNADLTAVSRCEDVVEESFGQTHVLKAKARKSNSPLHSLHRAVVAADLKDAFINSPCAYEEVPMHDHVSEENDTLVESTANVDASEVEVPGEVARSGIEESNAVEGLLELEAELSNDTEADGFPALDSTCIGATITIEGDRNDNQAAMGKVEGSGKSSDAKSWKKLLLQKAQIDSSGGRADDNETSTNYPSPGFGTASQEAILPSITKSTPENSVSSDILSDTLHKSGSKSNSEKQNKGERKPESSSAAVPGDSWVARSKNMERNSGSDVPASLSDKKVRSNVEASKVENGTALDIEDLVLNANHSEEERVPHNSQDNRASNAVECHSSANSICQANFHPELHESHKSPREGNQAVVTTSSSPLDTQTKTSHSHPEISNKTATPVTLNSVSSSFSVAPIQSLDFAPASAIHATETSVHQDWPKSYEYCGPTSVGDFGSSVRSILPRCSESCAGHITLTTATVAVCSAKMSTGWIDVDKSSLCTPSHTAITKNSSNVDNPDMSSSAAAVPSLSTTSSLLSPSSSEPTDKIIGAIKGDSRSTDQGISAEKTVHGSDGLSQKVSQRPGVVNTRPQQGNSSLKEDSCQIPIEQDTTDSTKLKEKHTLGSKLMFTKNSKVSWKTTIARPKATHDKPSGLNVALADRGTFRGPQLKHKSSIQKTIATFGRGRRRSSSLPDQPTLISNRPEFMSSRGQPALSESQPLPSSSSSRICPTDSYASVKDQAVDPLRKNVPSPQTQHDTSQLRLKSGYAGRVDRSELMVTGTLSSQKKTLKSILRKPTENFDCRIENKQPELSPEITCDSNDSPKKTIDERLQEGESVIQSLLPLIKSRSKKKSPRMKSQSGNQSNGSRPRRGRPPKRGGRGRGRPKKRKRLPSISSDEDIIDELNAGTSQPPLKRVKSPAPKGKSSDSETEDSGDDLVSFMGIPTGNEGPGGEKQQQKEKRKNTSRIDVREDEGDETDDDNPFSDLSTDSDEDAKPLSELVRKITSVQSPKPDRSSSQPAPKANALSSKNDHGNIFTKLSKEMEVHGDEFIKTALFTTATSEIDGKTLEAANVKHGLDTAEENDPAPNLVITSYEVDTRKKLNGAEVANRKEQSSPQKVFPQSSSARYNAVSNDEVQPFLPTPPTSPKSESSPPKTDLNNNGISIRHHKENDSGELLVEDQLTPAQSETPLGIDNVESSLSEMSEKHANSEVRPALSLTSMSPDVSSSHVDKGKSADCREQRDCENHPASPKTASLRVPSSTDIAEKSTANIHKQVAIVRPVLSDVPKQSPSLQPTNTPNESPLLQSKDVPNQSPLLQPAEPQQRKNDTPNSQSRPSPDSPFPVPPVVNTLEETLENQHEPQSFPVQSATNEGAESFVSLRNERSERVAENRTKGDGISNLIAAAAELAGLTDSGSDEALASQSTDSAVPGLGFSTTEHHRQDENTNISLNSPQLDGPILPSKRKERNSFTSYNMPEAESCHGFLEVCMSAPPNRTYALRRIPYVKTNADVPCSNARSNRVDPPAPSACATYLRLRDIICLIKVHPEVLYSLVLRCEATLYSANEYTRRLFTVVYDPVCKFDEDLAKMTMRHNRGERLHEFLDHMIVLDKFLHSLLPRFYHEGLSVHSSDVPRYVNVKIFKPITAINDDVVKIFRRPYMYNSTLRNKDDKIKCNTMTRRRFSVTSSNPKRRKRSNDSTGSTTCKAPVSQLQGSTGTLNSTIQTELRHDRRFSLEHHPQGFYLSPELPRQCQYGVENIVHHQCGPPPVFYGGGILLAQPIGSHHGRGPTRMSRPDFYDVSEVRQMTVSPRHRSRPVEMPRSNVIRFTGAPRSCVIQETDHQQNIMSPVYYANNPQLTSLPPASNLQLREDNVHVAGSADERSLVGFTSGLHHPKKDNIPPTTSPAAVLGVGVMSPIVSLPEELPAIQDISNSQAEVNLLRDETTSSKPAKRNTVAPDHQTSIDETTVAITSVFSLPQNSGDSESGIHRDTQLEGGSTECCSPTTYEFLKDFPSILSEQKKREGKVDETHAGQTTVKLSGIDILAEAAAKVYADDEKSILKGCEAEKQSFDLSRGQESL